MEDTRRTVPARLTRAAFAHLGPVVPGLAARLASALFCAAPTARSSARIEAFLATGQAFRVRAPGVRVRAWAWGSGPVVYLLHGWGGRAAQLSGFVPPLVERGYRVVAFDAPAHGASPGRLSSLPAFASALRAVVAEAGAAHAVVAHSMGAAATALAMQAGLRVEHVVFVGPPADPSAWAEAFARELLVPAPVMDRMKDRLARRAGVRWEDLSVPAAARTLTAPLLIVHDRDDAEVPWADGESIARAWPGAQLVSTSGLGHRRVLRDRGVIARTVAFVAGAPQDVAGAGAVECDHSGEPGCETCATEADLFHRETRRRTFPETAA